MNASKRSRKTEVKQYHVCPHCGLQNILASLAQAQLQGYECKHCYNVVDKVYLDGKLRTDLKHGLFIDHKRKNRRKRYTK